MVGLFYTCLTKKPIGTWKESTEYVRSMLRISENRWLVVNMHHAIMDALLNQKVYAATKKRDRYSMMDGSLIHLKQAAGKVFHDTGHIYGIYIPTELM